DRGWNIDNVNINKETFGNLPPGWSQFIDAGSARWQATTATDSNVVNSAPNSLWFGVKGNSPDNYNDGGRVAGSAISPAYNLFGANSATISFNQSWDTGADPADKM